MNKRGDIPTVLVLIGAMMLYTTAFYFLFTIGNSTQVNDVSVIGKEANLIQDYLESEAKIILINSMSCIDKYDNKLCIQNAVKDREFLIEGTDFFAKLRTGEFTYTGTNGKYQLNIQDVHIRTSEGNNSLERTFDITVNT